MRNLLSLTALTCAAPLAAWAENAAQSVTIGASGFPYALFETTVEHADLTQCPTGIDTQTQFCRLTLAADAAHVFVFELYGDQPLRAVHSYDLANGLPQF